MLPRAPQGYGTVHDATGLDRVANLYGHVHFVALEAKPLEGETGELAANGTASSLPPDTPQRGCILTITDATANIVAEPAGTGGKGDLRPPLADFRAWACWIQFPAVT